MDTISERLLQIIDKFSGGNRAKFCKNAGIPPSTLQSYITGRMPHGDHLKRICEFYKVDINWLLTGEGFPYIIGEEKEGEFDNIPLAEARLNAGGGSVVLSEGFNESYSFRKDWVAKIATSRKNLVLMFVQGDSMEPAIMDDDIVMIDRGRLDIHTGRIYAVGVSDTIMIKRLELLPDQKFNVISDNKRYSPYIIGCDAIRIIGQVIWFARELVKKE
jgi:phage repressor protein C with HTH and peptisase S24 domain